MGIMPPYDPFRDTQVAWAIARVVSCDPASATWGSPALVRFDIDHVLRGALPRTLVALFDAPREAQQSRFYVARALGPDPTPEAIAVASAQQAALDATPIELPRSGTRVVVWFGERVALFAHDASDPSPRFQMFAHGTSTVIPPEGAWTIPTLRRDEPSTLPIRSRWIDHDAGVEREVRRRLGIPTWIQRG